MQQNSHNHGTGHHPVTNFGHLTVTAACRLSATTEILVDHQEGGRGQDGRAERFAYLFTRKMASVGPHGTEGIAALSNKGKMNKCGRVTYKVTFPHTNVLRCSVAARGLLLIHRFGKTEQEPVPDFLYYPDYFQRPVIRQTHPTMPAALKAKLKAARGATEPPVLDAEGEGVHQEFEEGSGDEGDGEEEDEGEEDEGEEEEAEGEGEEDFSVLNDRDEVDDALGAEGLPPCSGKQHLVYDVNRQFPVYEEVTYSMQHKWIKAVYHSVGCTVPPHVSKSHRSVTDSHTHVTSLGPYRIVVLLHGAGEAGDASGARTKPADAARPWCEEQPHPRVPPLRRRRGPRGLVPHRTHQGGHRRPGRRRCRQHPSVRPSPHGARASRVNARVRRPRDSLVAPRDGKSHARASRPRLGTTGREAASLRRWLPPEFLPVRPSGHPRRPRTSVHHRRDGDRLFVAAHVSRRQTCPGTVTVTAL